MEYMLALEYFLIGSNESKAAFTAPLMDWID